jgi:hypothetical protein
MNTPISNLIVPYDDYITIFYHVGNVVTNIDGPKLTKMHFLGNVLMLNNSHHAHEYQLIIPRLHPMQTLKF